MEDQLLSVKDALANILAAFSILPSEPVELQDLLGRVLAEDLISSINLPPFTNSGMDGFAVIAQDLRNASKTTPVSLKILGDIPAGVNPNMIIRSGATARIMTGAVLPLGADAVVPIEETDFWNRKSTDPSTKVEIYRQVSTGDFVRPSGQDLKVGTQVFDRGHVLQPQDIGLLSSIGKTSVHVICKPRIALLSTGDELLPPGEELTPGKIHDSNTYTLSAACQKAGADLIQLGTTPDRPDEIRAKLDLAVEREADLILTSAGVSVGEFDYIRPIVEEQGNLEFWRVNMRPGKPLVFGSYRHTRIIGLPGNPVSSYIAFLVFVLPVLRYMQGLSPLKRNTIHGITGEAIESDGRESYLRGFAKEKDGKIIFTLAGHQGSGNLFALTKANALLILPSGVKSLPTNSECLLWLLDGE